MQLLLNFEDLFVNNEREIKKKTHLQFIILIEFRDFNLNTT